MTTEKVAKVSSLSTLFVYNQPFRVDNFVWTLMQKGIKTSNVFLTKKKLFYDSKKDT